jgi:hypothetical protein
MKYFCCTLSLACTSLASLCVLTAPFPGTNRQSNNQFVKVQPEIVLPVIANQPDCPLQFENVNFLAGVKGSGGPSLDVRNRGPKPLSSFTIAWFILGGGSGTWEFKAANASEWVRPGGTWPTRPSRSPVEIVPLTESLLKRLKLDGPMQAICVLMIVKTEATDGTVYNSESLYKSLWQYHENSVTNAAVK